MTSRAMMGPANKSKPPNVDARTCRQTTLDEPRRELRWKQEECSVARAHDKFIHAQEVGAPGCPGTGSAWNEAGTP